MKPSTGEAALERSRRQMGESVRGLVGASGEPGLSEIGAGYWLALSGVASADLNAALVDHDDPAAHARVTEAVDALGVPAVLMMAGRARALEPEASWRAVGSMPFMACDLGGREFARDERVRVARGEDAPAVAELLADAFALAPPAALAITAVLGLEDPATLLYLLCEDGVAVSTVLAAQVDEALCLWCMATPAAKRRKGYARALLCDVLARASRNGAGVALLGATPAGEPLYRGVGFSELEAWSLYLREAAAR